MRRYGHWGLTLVFTAPLIIFLPIYHSVPIGGMMIIMTFLPNKEIPITFVGRRGFMHTIWFAFLAAGIVFTAVVSLLTLVEIGIVELGGRIPSTLQPVLTGVLLATGTALGVISHIIGDTLTGGGSKPPVKPFWPVSRKRIRFGVQDQRHPVVNEGLFKFMVIVTIFLFLIKLNVRPIFLY